MELPGFATLGALLLASEIALAPTKRSKLPGSAARPGRTAGTLPLLCPFFAVNVSIRDENYAGTTPRLLPGVYYLAIPWGGGSGSKISWLFSPFNSILCPA